MNAPAEKAANDKETRISLASLPPQVSKMLASLDADGDGNVDWQEIVALKTQHTESLSKSRFFRKMFVILFCLCVPQRVAVAATFWPWRCLGGA